jgi:hypothetical protein
VLIVLILGALYQKHSSGEVGGGKQLGAWEVDMSMYQSNRQLPGQQQQQQPPPSAPGPPPPNPAADAAALAAETAAAALAYERKQEADNAAAREAAVQKLKAGEKSRREVEASKMWKSTELHPVRTSLQHTFVWDCARCCLPLFHVSILFPFILQDQSLKRFVARK